MILKISTDGGSKGNPGPSSIGMVFYIDGKRVFTYREDIGIATNNVAEYTAVIRALEKLKYSRQANHRETGCRMRQKNENLKIPNKILKVEVYSDSRLLVNQVKGLFKVNNARIRELILKIKILEQEIGLSISYHLIPREQNTIADGLVNGRLLATVSQVYQD